MEMKLPENCNQCHNACPADALRCGRGRDYFDALSRGETPLERQPRAESADPLVRALSACGRIVDHVSARFRDKGTDERELFSSLTQEEQEELLRLLEKLNQTWQAEREKHHGSEERGERREPRERGRHHGAEHRGGPAHHDR